MSQSTVSLDDNESLAAGPGSLLLAADAPLPPSPDSLPAEARKIIEEMLTADEKLLFLETPNYWRVSGSVLVVSALGTVAVCIIWIFFRDSFALSTHVTFAVFPAVLIVAIYGFWRTKISFFAITDQRVLMKPVFEKRWAVELRYLKEVTLETNYLFCRKEIALRRFVPSERRVKVTFVDAVPRLEFYHQYFLDRIAERRASEPAASAAQKRDDVKDTILQDA